MTMPPRTQLINFRPLIEQFHHHDINSSTTTNPISIPQDSNNNQHQQQNLLFHSFSAPLTSGFLEHFYALHFIPSSINNNNNFVDNKTSGKFCRSKSESSALDILSEQLRPHYTLSPPIASVDLICKKILQKSLIDEDDPLLEEEEETNNDFLPLRAPPPSTLINTTTTTTLPSSKKLLHRVRFADECGLKLSTVRVMTEPSDYPPKISPAVLRRIKRAAMQSESKDLNRQIRHDGWMNSDDEEDDEYEEIEGLDDLKQNRLRSTWKLGFKQPASEYLKFRDTLDRLKVALENVMLRNDLGRMNGTIKVANIAYEKNVFLRITTDRWKTFRDRPAKFQCSPSKAFDTFRFDLDIPRNDKQDSRIEFCVCYIANNIEYWDSNGGNNFVLIPDEPPLLPLFISSKQHHFKDNFDTKVYY